MSCSKQFKHCKTLLFNFNARKTTCKVHQLQCARVLCRYNSHDSKSSSFSEKLDQGPTFQHFVANANKGNDKYLQGDAESVPYLEEDVYSGHGRKVYFDTYGCQMNFNDTEIAWSILKDKGYSKAESVNEADVVLLMTCSIRENAEQKIWNMVERYKGFKRKAGKKNPLRIGILGCMAERLKQKILDKEKMVDLVCGPDAYRDLPRLLAMTPESRQSAVNVMLSLEETYADVMPVRINEDSKTAFV
ncbi:mitochondrial tRNA methylthiotransferase CDK5RAP1-like, partial [Saccostrea cucullata]|uniref:mitochondrial tRNA methylthiotransferase CDK5RAP1-like n=1 Tax=Saccostrea cuccullata TaxID=36930 RepID=UPI002ED51712